MKDNSLWNMNYNPKYTCFLDNMAFRQQQQQQPSVTFTLPALEKAMQHPTEQNMCPGYKVSVLHFSVRPSESCQYLQLPYPTFILYDYQSILFLYLLQPATFSAVEIKETCNYMHAFTSSRGLSIKIRSSCYAALSCIIIHNVLWITGTEEPPLSIMIPSYSVHLLHCHGPNQLLHRYTHLLFQMRPDMQNSWPRIIF